MRLSGLALALLLSYAAPRSAHASDRWRPYSLQVVDEYGASLPTYALGPRTFVLGAQGQRYLLRITNESSRRVEVVVSVDGRDVLDGQPADWSKRGYLVAPYDSVTIDGFRLSDSSVAAFRFSSVAASYAAQMGDARDVGAIGVAVFSERAPYAVRHHSLIAPSPKGSRPELLGDDVGGAAPQVPGALRSEAQRRPGLGTEFGEEHESHVYRVEFARASTAPATVLSVRYNDRSGLLALGIDVDRTHWSRGRDTWLRETAEPFRRNAPYAQPPPGWRR